MSVLIVETKDVERFRPVTETRFLWEITCGAFDAYRRAQRIWKTASVFSPRFDERPYAILKDEYPFSNETDLAVNAQWAPPSGVVTMENTLGVDEAGNWLYCSAKGLKENELRALAANDLKALNRDCQVVEMKDGLFLRDVADLVKMNAARLERDSAYFREAGLVEMKENVLVYPSAVIRDYVSIRADDGPVVIDEGAVVGEFSLIEGPAYIGKRARIDQAKIRSGTTVGEACRIGGEVEETVVESFSNKHHEGFLGHSYLGSWVNIGAIATTSDLKNNYGSVRIQTGGETLDTGTNKFGSVICDYAKIGIGMMLNTGTVIGAGCNLFQEHKPLPKFLPRFSWGIEGRYEIERFLSDTRTVMSRRGQTLSAARAMFLNSLYTI